MTSCTDSNCLFCRIISGDEPSTTVYEDDKVLAFRDKFPAAPVHILIIPREHIATLNDTEPKHAELLGHIMLTASRLAKELDLADDGYRVVMNCNRQGGQTVYHIHLHLLGERPMRWPPG
ncbi:histidine triad nucleotide-binding protein [Parendozoicomonas sp. Alg238-R29]|uniref:histidine triad nucleotide-binding protein n=1 Tax=Parendozoicomonas sp. Alg238-R29 TaxID=2993446 RepID=UPI00248ED269|nr:histidine triad nucleotide-binding protein [Parendozoicomonas sp. Alg238-R29]